MEKDSCLFSGGERLDQLLNCARAMCVQRHLDQLLLLCSLLQDLRHGLAQLRSCTQQCMPMLLYNRLSVVQPTYPAKDDLLRS